MQKLGRSFSTHASKMSKRISYTVHGTVQGVCFRDFTVKKAKSLSLTGFVRNASDGTVKGEAQGSSDNMTNFLGHLNRGPSAAKVSKVEHDEIAVKEGESGFSEK
ncbi:Acylphosphatase [Tothia fuscella]|uniref:Acylphosphatase n=1 Tax=Tothia fuscella TaxID=1048955 RepID=A0A9P4TTF1_9PEZI|nr:Acylphosphatase [Tothia fuscella]